MTGPRTPPDKLIDNPSLQPAEAASLLDGFRNPPAAARPRAWWHWLSGNVSREGAELDLEWLRRVGIGGVHAFSGGGFPEAPVVDPLLPFMSDGWREVFNRSARLANDFGMELGVAGSAGWSQTGGIHVPPADGMKKYVWSVLEVEGGADLDVALPPLPTAVGPFQAHAKTSPARQLSGDVGADAFVVAYRTPGVEQAPEPTVRSSTGEFDVQALRGGDLASFVNLAIPEGETSSWLDVDYREPVRICALTLGVAERVDVEVLWRANEAESWRLAGGFELAGGATPIDHGSPQHTLAFTACTARCFRVILKPRPAPEPLPGLPAFLAVAPPPPVALTISSFRLETGARVHRFESKAGFESTLPANSETPDLPEDASIDHQSVIDVSDRLGADGRLRWAPPSGRWTIMRFGWSLTGATNNPAEAEATGLEVDKLDPDAVRRYIDRHLSLYEQSTDLGLGDGIHALVTDSWEAGVQNWTPGLIAEFQRRRGYDLMPYAPVLAGRVVTDAATSDRFLWDFRLTLKEMIADHHYEVLAEAARSRGMAYYTEVQGDNPRAIGDSMTMKARSDIPTGEYWYRPFGAGEGQFSLKADLEEAASAAHVYGKPFAAAESLTVAAGMDPWAFSPRLLKPVMDEIFARGINRVLIHDSRHQPLADATPGLILLIFGQFFNRNDTWAEDAGAWIDYISRSSFLLQQGRFVADVAYFYGEDANLTELMRRRLNTDVPQGLAYDYINPEAFQTLLTVQDGVLTVPCGMSWRILMLPDHVDRMTGRTARRLLKLVRGGAVVAGRRPIGALGLETEDAEVLAIAAELWGDDPKRVEGRRVGLGRVYPSLEAALAGEGVEVDLDVSPAPDWSELLFLHRRTGSEDVYFLSNQLDSAREYEISFRVTGKVPAIWRAETGRVEALVFTELNGRVTASVCLEPHEALFVVFQETPVPGAETHRLTEVLATLEGPWTVAFEPGRGAPTEARFDNLEDWTTSADRGIRYFSGSATYSRSLDVPDAWFDEGRRISLDLGLVRELAVVILNGVPVETTWRPPYKVDITGSVRRGRNLLEIRVVNLWPNRLIGDRQPGAEPVAFAPMSPYQADSPLLPSGLMGPVRLLGSPIDKSG